MITADDDRRADLACCDQVVEGQAGLVALAVTEPANPGRQPLETDLLSSAAQPLMEPIIVGKQIQYSVVGNFDVSRVAGQCDPAERSFALAKQRPDVGRHEAREL